MGKRKGKKTSTSSQKSTSKAKKSEAKKSTKKEISPKIESFKKRHVTQPIWVVMGVTDMERAIKWYSEVMEFEKGNYIPEAGWCDFKLPVKDAMLGLNVLQEGEVTQGSVSFNLPVDDLEKASETLKAKGVEVTDIIDIPNMISMANCTDSEGNPITLLAEPRIKQ
ncbi:MAG: hypothetical protein HeimC3_29020 [Candidatus Heimdallarchaeota archaeon LC_3]|nr:MAG: hypothetical protein HeimC3_29020 [Candidatus Heimdallarchaeota archaeon LC_3]